MLRGPFGVEPEDTQFRVTASTWAIAPRAVGVDQLGLATLTVLGTAFAAQALPGGIRKPSARRGISSRSVRMTW